MEDDKEYHSPGKTNKTCELGAQIGMGVLAKSAVESYPSCSEDGGHGSAKEFGFHKFRALWKLRIRREKCAKPRCSGGSWGRKVAITSSNADKVQDKSQMG